MTNNGASKSATTATTTDADAELKEFSHPIWFNAHKAKNALQMYEGISRHAPEINESRYQNFFGVTQQLALDGAVISICKLYDTSNPKFEKHTIPELLAFFDKKFSGTDSRSITARAIEPLGIRISDLNLPELAGARDPSINSQEFLAGRKLLLGKLSEKMPSRDNNSALQKLLLFRNKMGAHQERLDDMLKATLQALPSLEEMEKLVDWAENFCFFVMNTLSSNTAYTKSVVSTKMSALNLVAKVLDKDWEKLGAKERDKFYGRSA